ncbi:MAG: PAS domain-containing protein [Rhizobiaceae bacterium]|nr:PAS domain-containing protein [Rhizobiaceae bacterium]MCV0406922.1 PAS domain-containing protein [Rhizobiaceae bacterium]
MRRFSARRHLVVLIAAAALPAFLFSAYSLTQYAFSERQRYEREALQVARQVGLVVEAELHNLETMLKALATSEALAGGDFAGFHAEASRLVRGTDRVILLLDANARPILRTGEPYGSTLSTTARAPGSLPAAPEDVLVGDVYFSEATGDYRIPLSLSLDGPEGERMTLSISVPARSIHDAMLPAVPPGWIVGIGDRTGTFVTRSEMHEEATGQPGLPEYLAKASGRSGTFTSENFLRNDVLLAGYYRPAFSNWLYGANIPLSVAEAPLWRSLAAIGALGLLCALISVGLAWVFGRSMAGAARGLAARARALGHGEPVTPLETTVTEFAEIGDALVEAQRAIEERTSELDTVLATVPAGVWFTYDPTARRVIRNRFAAELMGLPTEGRTTWGAADQVIDTRAFKDGKPVSRDERPLTLAMHGQQTDGEEFTYVLPSGEERHLLSSARSIRDKDGTVIGAVQISLDISDRKRAEEQRKLLVNELNHRVKNTLAVVQSIAVQTLKNAADVSSAQAALVSRLQSLAKAHDVLTQESWGGAYLRDLLAATLAPQVVLSRFQLSGERVWLSPNLAVALAMTFHELATNAIKYGALSVDAGAVSISWTIEQVSDDASKLVIEWRERDGPPIAHPRRKGFGSRMLSMSLRPHSGSVDLRFEPEGLVCVMEARLATSASANPPRGAESTG